MYKCKEEKTDRFCNNCGYRLLENSPNWFQCSEGCRREKWDKTCKTKELENAFNTTIGELW